MIRLATLKDLNTLVPFIYQMNQRPEYYSGYMSLLEESIQNDVRQAIQQEGVLVVETDNIQGVLVTHKNIEHKTIDVAGPYVIDADETTGKAFIQHVLTSFDCYALNFFFSDTSTYYHSLMTYFKAIDGGVEDILTLHEVEPYRGLHHVDVRRLEPNDHTTIKTMHDHIFPNAYIKGEALIEPSPHKETFVAIKEDDLIGYAHVKQMSLKAMLEVFALKADARDKGYAKPFLTHVLHTVLNKPNVQTIELVVEEPNHKAIALYETLGFTLKQRNRAFTLHK